MAYRLTTAVLLGALTLHLPQLFAAAALSADLGKLISDASRNARVPVIVRFKKENEISELGSSYNNKHQYQDRSASRPTSKKQFRKNVFNGLKEQTQRSSAALAGLLRQHGVKTQLKPLWTINGIAFDAPPELLDEIAELPGVTRITADMRLTMNTSQAEEISADPLWNINRLNTSRLWQQGITGEGVVVAIMDSGVDINHPDLSEQWRGGINSWFDPYGEHDFPTDLVGHGTQALGLILGGDESGYQVGLAPEAEWIAAKIFDDGNQTTLSAIHQAFQWLLDPDGDPLTDDAPDLVNNSWGFANTINQCYQEFDEDIRLLREAGIGVVFSAGNYGPFAESSISPANNPGSLSVGSIDQLDEIELLSSRGPGACDGGVFPKLVAPGALVFTTDLLPVAYNVVSGTSFAAPHVTGAMALLKSAFPEAPISQIETALYDSAVDLGEPGTDDQFGYGLVDISAAYDLLYASFGSAEESLLLFSEPLYSVDEGTERLIVTVRRLGGSAGEVSVEYATTDDEARSGDDYVRRSGRLNFADGETLRSFEIPIIDDREDEENEDFYITLSDVRGRASLGHQDEVEVVILDDDGAGSIAFSAVSFAVNESREEAIVSLIRTGGSAGEVEVEYRVIADTATADSDYIAADGKVRFLAGETEKQIIIELIDDTLFEGSERFQLLIAELEGGADIGEPASTTVTILDDDPDGRFASIYLDAVSYEINENDAEVNLEVIRAGNTENSVSVEYATLDGSAKQNEDYESADGILTFPAGTTRRILSLKILNDTVYEQESSFTLLLSNAGEGAVISDPSTAIIRIIDDDALPFVSIHSAVGYRSEFRGNPVSGGLKERDRLQGQEEERRNRSSSSLQIFDLTLKGYAPSDRQGIEALQNLGRDKESEARSGVSSCGPGNSAEEAQSAGNCFREENSEDTQTQVQQRADAVKMTGEEQTPDSMADTPDKPNNSSGADVSAQVKTAPSPPSDEP